MSKYKHMNILMIEDNEDHIELVSDSLEKAFVGINITTVLDGRKAVDHILSLDEIPDVVLLDYHIPLVNGIEILKLIKDKHLDLAVIVLTGDTSIETAIESMKEGALDFLPKMEGFYDKLPEMIEKVFEIHANKLERKKAEEALRESEQRLKNAQLIGKIGDWEYDIKTQKIKWSEQVFKLYERDKSLGPPTFKEEADYYSPEQIKILHDNASIAIEKGIEFNYDLQVKLPNGKTTQCTAYMTPVKDKSGRVVKLIGTVQDITERKQAENALQLERDKLVSVFEAMEDGIYITSQIYDTEYVNPVLVKDFGSYEGRKCYEYFHDREEVCPWCKNDDVFAGKTVRWEWYSSKNKKTYDLIDTPLKNPDGSISKLEMFRDITAHKKAEEEKAQLEEQYRQSQKVESIGRLAGGMAHDLNNLLVPIIGYAELLSADFDPGDDRKESADEIVRAAFRARDLVQQLLAFSRKQILEYKTLDMNKIIKGFEKLMRRTIREDIDIEIIPSPDIRTIRADIGQIEQVIMNLCVNAQDAMQEGGKLTIETAMVMLDESYTANHPGTKPGEYVMLAISDTGCGIDEETRKLIFEPFYSTKGNLGTGLGLATVYGIVKQHGGNIWVYSEPGKGSTFKVYLPVSKKEHVEKKVREKSGGNPRGSETILLVEDDEQVRHLARAILRKQGYTVLAAENGAEALTVLESHGGPVNQLLTDVIMPGMNGSDLYAKAAEKYPGLKVLYMSGYPENIIAHHGVLDEGVQFIQKPFSSQALAVKVRDALDKE